MYSCNDLLTEGLPHSDIHGSTPARGSPWLFAACHVLHRLLVPRHPPNALIALEITEPFSWFSPCTEAKHDVDHTCSAHDTFKLSITLNDSERIAAVSEAGTSLHQHIRSDLADRGTPRDVPEPDLHCQRTTTPKLGRRTATTFRPRYAGPKSCRTETSPWLVDLPR